MSNPLSKTLLQTRGAEHQAEAPIIAVQASRGGQTFAALTMDGELHLIPREGLRQQETWRKLAVHEGAISLAQGCEPESFLSGGEDGCVVETRADGTMEERHKGRSWVDCLASTPTHWACACKKEVHLYKAGHEEAVKVLEHPSALSGLAFDAKGKQLAASHYNGASLWYVQSKEARVRALEWKGSHTGLCLHPGGEALVTSMQENELHGWRLSDGHNMRMSGYPRKIASMSFTRKGRWLATSGADAAVLWPFFGGGPMGKPPMELARLPGLFVTCVCAHPTDDILAIGFEDGTVLLAEVPATMEDNAPGADRILPLCNGQRSGGVARGAVNAIAFTPQGGAVIFGTEEGYIGVVDLSAHA
ncbi:MAG: WD40 repeat domain-containing protein [Bombella apis]|nr:WD40 repeat domain-containing protein [Bombella apis]